MRISKQGAEAISQALTEMFMLQKLTLFNVNLDCDLMLTICKGLESSMSLEYLDLR